MNNALRLYAITDDALLPSALLLERCEQAIAGGISALQVRNKSRSYPLALLADLAALCASQGVMFFINDDIELAARLGANVHLGQSDCAAAHARKLLGPSAIIGISCQSVEQAHAAALEGANYIGVGAVFATGSKQDAKQLSRSQIAEICERSALPVVLIGGINEVNIASLKGLKFSGVAVISAIFGANDPEAAASRLKTKLGEIL